MTESRIIIFSGAGLSAESGIATFRTGVDALWDGYDPNLVCNLSNFLPNYEDTHKFYNERRKQYANVQPNLAHQAIAALEAKYGADRVINLTTNIDTLLEAAGCTNVHHIHGRADELIRNYNPETGVGTHVDKIDSSEVLYDIYLRKGELVKPNVVFFEEANLHVLEDGETRVEPLYAHLNNVIRDIRPSDIVVVVGASLQVVPIHYSCMFQPFTSVNVNPEKSHAASECFDYYVQKTAVEAFTDPDFLSLIEKNM